MKKLISFFVAITVIFILIGCSGKTSDRKMAIETESLDPKNPVKVKIGATNVPHAEILEFIKPKLEKEGIKLDIIVYQDYYLPNKNLQDKEIDLNYFQHLPFLNLENKEKGYKLENAGAIHIEPIGLYSNKIKKIDELKDGALILVSNSKSDWGRILKILQKANLIKIKENVDVINATFDDIKENPKNLQFKYDNDPAIMLQYFKNGEGDLVAINSNFAVDGGIIPEKEALILEDTNNNPYVNIIAVREGDKDKIVTKKILEILKSEETQNYIKEKYKGSIISA